MVTLCRNTNSFPNSTMNVPYFLLLRGVTFRSCEPALYTTNFLIENVFLNLLVKAELESLFRTLLPRQV